MKLLFAHSINVYLKKSNNRPSKYLPNLPTGFQVCYSLLPNFSKRQKNVSQFPSSLSRPPFIHLDHAIFSVAVLSIWFCVFVWNDGWNYVNTVFRLSLNSTAFRDWNKPILDQLDECCLDDIAYAACHSCPRCKTFSRTIFADIVTFVLNRIRVRMLHIGLAVKMKNTFVSFSVTMPVGLVCVWIGDPRIAAPLQNSLDVYGKLSQPGPHLHLHISCHCYWLMSRRAVLSRPLHADAAFVTVDEIHIYQRDFVPIDKPMTHLRCVYGKLSQWGSHLHLHISWHCYWRMRLYSLNWMGCERWHPYSTQSSQRWQWRVCSYRHQLACLYCGLFADLWWFRWLHVFFWKRLPSAESAHWLCQCRMCPVVS